MPSKRPLLLENEGEDGDLVIKVNEEYAKRFEYNKRREQLHRLQEKDPALAAKLQRQAERDALKAVRQQQQPAARGEEYEEDEEESSEDEEPDPEELAADTDKVLETLVRIKRQDPAIYQKDLAFFPDDEEDEEDEEGGESREGAQRTKAEKPVYLRTLLAQQALSKANGAPGDGSSSEDEDEEGGGRRRLQQLPDGPDPKSYVAEQDELKAAFLEAAGEVEGELGEAEADLGGVLRRRKGSKAAAAAAGEQGGADKEAHVNELLTAYFGREEELSGTDKFLRNFIANKAWIDKEDAAAARHLGGSEEGSGSEGAEGEGPSNDEGAAGGRLEEDEEFLEEADRFEAAYNFRFEEPGGARIVSHPRVIGDSVRMKESSRKRQRAAKAVRLAEEKAEHEEEVKRLKNMKKQEIEDKLREVQRVAGLNKAEALKQQPGRAVGAAAAAAAAGAGGGGKGSFKAGLGGDLLDELLAEDFDPEEYDKRMAAAFDDSYYEMEEEDADELFGEQEEEGLVGLSDIEACGSEGGEEEEDEGDPKTFKALRKKLKQQQQEGADAGADGGDMGSPGEEEGPGERERRQSALTEGRSELQRLLEEYYKLDYEDNIGGIRCRFRYKEVPKDVYGLSAADILSMSDKDLNQIVGLKKLAPYRDSGKKLRPNYIALQQAKAEVAAAAARQQGEKKKKKRHQGDPRAQGKRAWGRGGGNHKQQGDQRHRPDRRQQQQQQQGKGKPNQTHGHSKRQAAGEAELDPEARKKARLESYAKLSLNKGRTDGTAGKEDSKHQQQGKKRKRDEEKAAPPVGRLATIQINKPLTKAQKKNLKRALKRKQEKGGV